MVRWSLFLVVSIFFVDTTWGQVVPGTGQLVVKSGDDFEDENWSYIPNSPKASRNIDDQERHPLGYSKNGYWRESAKRGQPDIVKRVATPEGGLPGSKGALLMQSKQTGIPGRPSGQQQQDDLILRMQNGTGGSIPLSWQPNTVVHVYMPSFDQWDQRTGASLGIRCSAVGPGPNRDKRDAKGIAKLFSGLQPNIKVDTYYPGFFIQFNSKNDRRFEEDHAVILVRADDYGRDKMGPKITKPGWWTFGMSFTGDGRVHYYAHEGVEPLTAKDHLLSATCQGFKGQRFNTMFFNIVTGDNGRSWSTPWIIDDPKLYLGRKNVNVATGNRRRRQ